MKLSKLFMIALLVGTMGVIGCGDDDTTDPGTGNTGGGGSCNTGVCVDNSELRAACETAVQACSISPLPNCAELAIADICETN